MRNLIRKKIKQITVSLLSALMLISVANTSVSAENNDSVWFDIYGDSITEHDVVMIDENGNEYYRTIYCLQKDYVWPKEWTEYTEGLGHDSFLTSEQLEKITKLMYAGYPYNTVGLLNPIYDAYDTGDEWGKMIADYLAVSITQDAIWTLLEGWGIEGNTPEPRTWTGEEDVVYQALLNFANSGSIPGAISSDKVTIIGDNAFKLGSNGVWSTGPLEIDDPEGYKLSYSYTLPDGITAVDADGNPLTQIKGGTPFRLETNDINKIVGGAKIAVDTTVKIPDQVSYYETNDASPVSIDGKTKPFQTMLSVGIQTKSLSGSLDFSKPELGSLTITKSTVNGPDDAEFWFKADIDIKDGSGNETTGWFPFVKTHADGSTSNGTVYHFADTEMRFSLKSGESITINDLPKGVGYTITEYGLEENGTSLGNWTPSYTNETGTVGSSTAVEVTNTYAYSPVTVSVAAGTKTLLDLDNSSAKMDIAAGDYSFILFPDIHGLPMPEGSVYNPNTNREECIVTNGASVGQVAPIDFGSVTFDKEGIYSYTIQELQVTKPNVSGDMRHWHAVVTVTASGDKLSATVSHEHHHDDSHVPSEGCDHEPLSFENTFSRHEIDKEIGVNKTVVNNSSDIAFARNGYQFEVIPANSAATNYPDLDLATEGVQTSATITTGKSGEAFTGAIKFTEEWFNSFDTDHDGVAVLVYNINEIPKNSAGWTYDDRTATATITITKTIIEAKTDTTPEVADYDATILYSFPGETSTTSLPNFINRYAATGTYELKVIKQFNLDNPGSYIPKAGESYQFAINDDFERNDKSGYTLPTDKKVVITFDGTDNFSTNQSCKGTNVIEFTKAGNYRFELSEVVGDNEKMTYDNRNWIVDVEVTDNGSGTLETHAFYYREQSASTPLDTATFTNTYQPVVSTTLDLKKTLLGREWDQEDEFSIDVRHAELGTHDEAAYDPCDPDNLERSHVNMDHDYETIFTADHKELTLSNINFKKEGVYFVYLEENKRFSSDGMVYDPVVYVVRYEIEKIGNDLSLKSTDVYDATDGWSSREKLDASVLEFTNKVTNLSIQKVNNDGSKTNKYEFTLALKDKDKVPVKNVSIEARLAGKDTVLHFDENGEAKVFLRRGEKLRIIGLADGFNVDVTETSNIASDTTFSIAIDGVSDGETPGKKATVSLQAGMAYEVSFTNVDKEPTPHAGKEPASAPFVAPKTGIK